MTTILLIRHGQSLANWNGIFVGQLDYPLSDLGKQQAELTADYIAKHYTVDRIWKS